MNLLVMYFSLILDGLKDKGCNIVFWFFVVVLLTIILLGL